MSQVDYIKSKDCKYKEIMLSLSLHHQTDSMLMGQQNLYLLDTQLFRAFSIKNAPPFENNQ